MPERFPSKVRDPADNNDPHKIGRREPRAEYLGWLHCRQINEIVDHRAWMSSQARFPRRLSPPDSSVFSKFYLALLLQRGNKHAEAAEYWRRGRRTACSGESAARCREG